MKLETINKYIELWRGKGYPDDIPDEVPYQLSELGLAPSYKEIAIAILKNDHDLKILGFSAGFKSKYYSVLKRIELEKKGLIKKESQLDLFK